MAIMLKANTAVDVLIGPFVDDSDGNTAETGLTLSQADIRLSKNGQNMAQKNDANACTHDELGYYNCPLDTTDTNTEGQLTLCVHESGALPVRHEFNILAEAAWDSLFAAKDTGYMDVNVKAVSEDTTAADNLESACDNYSVTRGLSGTALPAAAADAAGGLPISDAGGLDLDTMDSNVSDILTDTGTTLDGKINTIDGIVDSILLDTAEIGAAGAGLTAVPWNASWDAEVQSECTDALNAYDPPTKAELDTAVANVSVDEIQVTALADLFNTDSGTDYASAIAGSVVKEIADNAGGSALTEAGIADAVWDEAQSGHVGAGTFGEIASEIADILVDTAEIGAAGAGLTNINLPNQTMDITGNLSGSVGSVTGAVGSVTGNVGGNVVGTVAGKTPSEAGDAMALTAGAVDDIWDEDVDTSHQTAGTAGKKLDDAGGAADPWATALPGAYGAGTAGKIVGDNIDAPISTVDTVVDAIKAVTDNLPDSGALTTIDGNVDSILTDTGTTLDGKIDTIDGIVDTILVDTADMQPRIVAIETDTGTTLDGKIDTIDTVVDGIQTDLSNGTDGLGALKTLIDTAQTDLDELTDTGTLSGVRLALMIDRIYTRLNHEVNVTDADGSTEIRNAADSGNIATGSITDDDTTTSQAKFSWA